MRRLAAVLTLLLPLAAEAGPTGGGNGGGGGGGRLGDVSGGMRGGGSGGGGGGGSGPRGGGGVNPRIDLTPVVVAAPVGVAVVGATAASVTSNPKYEGGPAKIDFYLGAQKVHESDGAFHVELGLRDGLFRIGGSITRFYERQQDGSQLTLTIPSMVGGIRVDDRGPTRVYLELGFANAHTDNDPIADTSVTGAVAGVRVEHLLTRGMMLTAEAHEMILEEDIRVHSARVGIKVGPVQGSFRVLDFNVGPALYGPELGLRF